MSTDSYSKRTELNVIDSDGTLILSHGSLIGESAYTRKMAMKNGKPWLHTDLNKMSTFHAAIILDDWISKNGIVTLNVAGPRASKDPLIYGLVTVILELAFALGTAKNEGTDKPESIDLPKTHNEIVDQIIDDLSLRDRIKLANLNKAQLEFINQIMTRYIQGKLNEWSIQQEETDITEPETIATEIWNRLKETHKLRIVE